MFDLLIDIETPTLVSNSESTIIIITMGNVFVSCLFNPSAEHMQIAHTHNEHRVVFPKHRFGNVDKLTPNITISAVEFVTRIIIITIIIIMYSDANRSVNASHRDRYLPNITKRRGGELSNFIIVYLYIDTAQRVRRR